MNIVCKLYVFHLRFNQQAMPEQLHIIFTNDEVDIRYFIPDQHDGAHMPFMRLRAD